MSRLVCKVCGTSIPYRSESFGDDRCDDCIRRTEIAALKGMLTRLKGVKSKEATRKRKWIKEELAFLES